MQTLNYHGIVQDADGILAILQDNNGRFPQQNTQTDITKQSPEATAPVFSPDGPGSESDSIENASGVTQAEPPKGNNNPLLQSPELPYESRFFSVLVSRLVKRSDYMYWDILNELLHKDCLQQLKKYKQHRFTTTYEHCRHVAVMSYQLAEKWHITVNEKALAVACMFHDYYLYDIKDEHLGPWHHGTRHASIAIRNAEKVYPLNNLEKEIIRSHMWPLNITQIPASREAWLVCLADKVCAVEEMFPFLATKKSHLSDSGNS